MSSPIASSDPLLDELNQAQRDAVLATSGPVLVVAGPGSGKTRVLTHRIARLIEREGVYPSEILAVTFTNKAAREMRHRVEALLGGRDVAGLAMGTFHSFGVRLLRQNPGLVADRLGVLPNFVIYDDGDQADIAKKSIVAVGLDPKQIAPRRVLGRISAAKSMMLTPEEFANAAETYDDEVIARIYKEYERMLRKANAVDFDDLLVLPIRLFDAAPSALERYQQQFRHILVDEYQDTNRVQYVLVAALAEKHRNLFVVGDPDQSIYGWRQADIRNILDFKTDYPDAREIHLELNYRSTRRIVETADRVIRDNTQRIDRRLRTENEDGARIVLRELSDGQHEAQFVVDEIRRINAVQGSRFDDMAVMYRIGAQSRVLEEAFRRSDIPYRIIGGLRFYERKEVKDILAILRLLYNPSDEISLERVVANFPIGKGIGPKAFDAVRTWATLEGRPTLDGFLALVPSLDALHSAPDIAGSGRLAAQRVGVVLAELRDEAGRLSLAELFDSIIERTNYQANFDQDSEEDMQRWANVAEMRSDLQEYDSVSPGLALQQYLDTSSINSSVDEMKEDPEGRVTLITLHSAKGLEFPIVFLAGVEDGLLPTGRAIESEYEKPELIEEERRLFYVGITRAKQLLYLTLTGRRATYGRWQASIPSRFLAAVPEQHLYTLGRREPARNAPTSARGSTLGDRVRQRSLDDWTPPAAPERMSAAPAAIALPAATYAAGQRVFHPKFGEGTIRDAVDRKGEQELAIDFKRHGVKRLLSSLAPLEVIG